MKSQLERAIKIAANTGDKIIVVDELNDRSSVVMNLDDYEVLLNGQHQRNHEINSLTEDELLDKINRDIVAWKEANSDKKLFNDLDDVEDSSFAEATEDDDDLEDEFKDDDIDFPADEEIFDSAAADKDKKETEFVVPNFDLSTEASAKVDAEGNIIPEPIEAEDEEQEIKNIVEENKEAEEEIDEPIENLPVETEVEKAEEVAIPAPSEVPAAENEDVYYYHEPTPGAEDKLEKVDTEIQPEAEPVKKEDGGFTSIKEELKKNKKAWAIPEEVKEKAAEV
jgi:hypothetical protein